MRSTIIRLAEAAASAAERLVATPIVAESNLHPRLKAAFEKHVGPELTPVQHQCIDEFTRSPRGIVVRAKTGTGKTYAFGIPVIHDVLTQKSGDWVNSVVFAPTRDLALQTQLSLDKVFSQCVSVPKVQTNNKKHSRGKYGYKRESSQASASTIPLVVGQSSYNGILAHFRPGKVAPLVVASPGRFMDMLRNQPSFRSKFAHLKNIIIDEADELLNGNFKQDMRDIIDELGDLAEGDKPKTMLFSATINEDVFELAERAIGREFPFVDVTGSKDQEVNKNITQTLVQTSSLANSYIGAVETLVSNAQHESNFKAIVFLSTTSAVDFFSELMTGATKRAGLRTQVWPFHGKLSQGKRDAVQQKFRTARSGILVASGIGARGMDFPNVNHVIQIGVCSEIDQHTHKIGRTGRNGAKGDALLFANKYEMPFVRALEKNGNVFNLKELDENDEDFLQVKEDVCKITKSMGRNYIHDTIYGFLGNYRNVPPKVARFNMTALAKDNAEMFNLFAGEPMDDMDEPLKLSMSYRNAAEMKIDFDELEDLIDFTGARPRNTGGNNNRGGYRSNNRGGNHNWNNRGGDRGGDRGYNRGGDRSFNRGGDRGGFNRGNDRRSGDRGDRKSSRW